MRHVLTRLLPATLLLGSASMAQTPEEISLEPVFGDAGFVFPVGVRHAGDGSGRVFVIERSGRLFVVSASGAALGSPFLDLRGEVGTSSEGGFLGVAFHPGFSTNGRVYVKYTYDADPGSAVRLVTRVSRFTVDASNPDRADPDSETVLLEIPQDSNNHNGGDLHFGPDGYLYIGMGDGGGSNDPCNRSQTLDPAELVSNCGSQHPLSDALALHGKMLRIDVDSETPVGENSLCAAAADGSAAYAAPAGNPFAEPQGLVFRDRFETPVVGCAEVWAWGLRNPYRFSFDRETGDLWIADVGQNTWEEINLVPAGSGIGLNFGWKLCEANWERGSTTVPCSLEPHAAPVIEYPTGAGQPRNCSVTGGYRYRGPVTSLQGAYVYGDFCSGRVWTAREQAGSWVSEEIALTGDGLVGFGEDEAGNLYLTRSNGEIFLFSAAGN